jgi:hypothetical protein
MARATETVRAKVKLKTDRVMKKAQEDVVALTAAPAMHPTHWATPRRTLVRVNTKG